MLMPFFGIVLCISYNERQEFGLLRPEWMTWQNKRHMNATAVIARWARKKDTNFNWTWEHVCAHIHWICVTHKTMARSDKRKKRSNMVHASFVRWRWENRYRNGKSSKTNGNCFSFQFCNDGKPFELATCNCLSALNFENGNFKMCQQRHEPFIFMAFFV